MSFSQRKFERLITARARLSERQRKVTLDLAFATRQLFHDVFIEDKNAPVDVAEAIIWDYGDIRDIPAVMEVVRGHNRTVTRKVMKASNPSGELKNVYDAYGRYHGSIHNNVLATNVGLLAVSLAGGSIPEVLLGETFRHEPLRFLELPIPFDASITDGARYARGGERSSSNETHVIILDSTIEHD